MQTRSITRVVCASAFPRRRRHDPIAAIRSRADDRADRCNPSWRKWAAALSADLRRRAACVALCATLFAAVAPPPAACAAEPLPHVTSGRIERIANFRSRFVDARNVDVWLPDGYDAHRRYDVLYVEDGQGLFDPAITWNRQAWRLDAALGGLIAAGKVAPTIVVAIWNNGKFRFSEYFPQKFLAAIDAPLRDKFIADYLQAKPQSDAYLRFLVEELKPYIDRHYATKPQREHTFAMGSSMGAVISIYAMNEYPQVFGGAAGLSTHWAGKLEPNYEIPLAAFAYLHTRLALPEGHRLYMDHGTAGLDAWYAPYQLFIDQIVSGHGYTAANFQSRVFAGATHAEADWGKRVAVPLAFLLPKP